MKKICLFFLVAMVLGLVSLAYAEDRTVNITFTYDGAVASEFRVYCDDIIVHSIPYGKTDDSFIMDITKNHLVFIVAAVVNGVEHRSDPFPKDVVEKMKDFKVGEVRALIKIKYS